MHWRSSAAWLWTCRWIQAGPFANSPNPIKFSAAAPEYRRAGTGPGAHTAAVLRELGYTDSDIEEFDKTGLFK